jgi:hypothetical protein
MLVQTSHGIMFQMSTLEARNTVAITVTAVLVCKREALFCWRTAAAEWPGVLGLDCWDTRIVGSNPA